MGRAKGERGESYEARYGTGLAAAEVGRGRTWIEVDLAAIGANLAAIRQLIAPRLLMAVVKANAYGHGMVPVARAAARLGAAAIGVATSEEALALRAAAVEGPVLVMGHSHPDHAAALVGADVAVSIYTTEMARALAAAATAAGGRAKVHLKIDTGLCRVGLPPQDAVPFANSLRDLAGLDWEGVFTHFSCADNGDAVRTREELDLFRGTLARLEAAGHRYRLRHAAASAALLDLPEAWLDMVRVGIAMYGHYPYRGCRQAVALRPSLAWKTRVTRVRRVPAGTGVGYGRTWIAPRDTVIATIPVGYADGLDKHLGNRGDVLVRGRRVPRAGTIAMDMSMIDAGALDRVEVGDEVVIIGCQGREVITAEEVAETAGTGVEHTLTLLSGRPSRVYIER